MLITPEQKRDQTDGEVCDNDSQRHETDANGYIYNTTTDQHLNNSNFKENEGESNNLSNDEFSDCNNPLSTSPSSSLSDIKNCNTQISYSPRSIQRLKGKFLPHINLSNSKKSSPGSSRRTLFISADLTDDITQPPVSPMSASPTRSPTLIPGSDYDKQQEVFSGRLYLIRHTGNVSPSPSPSSPSRVILKGFPFHSNASFNSPSSSPPSPSSPTISTNKRKTPVYMRVYRCNMDHFALVSRDSSYSSRPTYLNMRHSRVLPGDCLGRFVIAGHCDSGSLMEFETTDLPSLEKWLDALQPATPPGSPIRHVVNSGNNVGGSGSGSSCSPPIPKSLALPTLTETDEEN